MERQELTSSLCEVYKEVEGKWRNVGPRMTARLIWDDSSFSFLVLKVANSPEVEFKPNEIDGVDVTVEGAWSQKCHLKLSGTTSNKVGYGPGRYLCDFETSDENTKRQFEDAMKFVHDGYVLKQIYTLLKTRDKVPLDDIKNILTAHNVSGQFLTPEKIVEGFILDNKETAGKIVGDKYLSKDALSREHVSYSVVTEVNLKEAIGMSLACKSCGGPLDVNRSSGMAKCSHCGQTVVLPKALLDLL